MYHSNKSAFSEELFQNPTSEYRSAPFWSWNGKLEEKVLRQQMETFSEMGFGGFHIHSRIGLETEYLGDEFMRLVKSCNRFANEHNMLTWLYDEDKWPSGVGGGRVTCNPDYANRYLLLSPKLYPNGYLDRNIVQTSRLTGNGNVTLLCRFSVTLKSGKLVEYHRMCATETAENIWYAYLVVTENLAWFNNQPYVDSLNPKAIDCFTKVTHDKYFEAVGDMFSKTIPAIFTDEPCFYKMENLTDGNAQQDVGIPYTESMEEVYSSRYGESLLDNLPEIIWQRADGMLSKIRYHYHDCLAQMFADAYAGTLGKWCDAHNVMLTGHVLFEEKLDTQSRVVGEVMRALRPFALPGIDMLADRHEYTTAKQAQSVSHQCGRQGVLSELYGVTNWDYDFRGHKHQGDWQAALGVTTRVPHLAWMSMGGESKRDYPAPIDAHSTWYKKYKIIEDYFARVNTAMTRGKAHVRIGMLHPIESYWMMMGPDAQTAQLRGQMEERSQNVTEWLLFNLLDFDYLSEALLTELCTTQAGKHLQVGAMAYDVVVVPGMKAMRRSTLAKLRSFAKAGGQVIFMGEVPTYLDGTLGDDVKAFAASCRCIGYDKDALLEALEPYRDVEITLPNHLRTDRLIHQLRDDGTEKWLFVAQGKHDNRLELNHWFTQTGREDITVTVRGNYTVELYDAMTGKRTAHDAQYNDEHTSAAFALYPHDSLLLRLRKTEKLVSKTPAIKPKALLCEAYLPANVAYALDEPNVLLLDQAEYALNGAPWQPKEEILRLDNAVRKQCGYPLRTESFPQPWLTPKTPPEHTLQLRFIVQSEIAAKQVSFAFEGTPEVSLLWNGIPVKRNNKAWFVDTVLHVEELGALCAGENTLEMQIPYGAGTNIEWCYLLGDFGVVVKGDSAVVVEKPSQVAFGNLATQGFAFYGGKLQYQCEIDTLAGNVEIEIPEYYAALLSVQLDDTEQDVFCEPYCAQFQHVAAGRHRLCITAYGSRINTFGQVHNCNRKEEYFGPKTWRTTGKNWSYIYQLHQTGITVCPIVRCYQE